MDLDLYEPWHEHLKAIREGLADGKIVTSEQLTDFDIAVDYAASVLFNIGYRTTTGEMIFHMIKSLTDVETE